MCAFAANDALVTSSTPLYATQGGGYATRVDGKNVWHSDIPDFLVSEGVKIGDEIPEQWGLAAINKAAFDQSDFGLSDADEPITHESEDYWD